MRLMVMVLNRVELLDELLEKLMEKGIRGATILSSTGMARVLSQNDDFPMFGTLRVWLDPDRQESKTILMALKDDEVSKVKEAVHEVVGDLSQPDSAVLFTVPIMDVEGIDTQT